MDPSPKNQVTAAKLELTFLVEKRAFPVAFLYLSSDKGVVKTQDLILVSFEILFPMLPTLGENVSNTVATINLQMPSSSTILAPPIGG